MIFLFYLLLQVPTILLGQDSSSIVTGPDAKPKPFDQPSIDYSQYLRGKMSKDVRYTLSQIKIIRLEEKDNNFTLSILPLDQFGNFIENLTSREFLPEGILLHDYAKINSVMTFLNESKLSVTKEFINLHFLIENSSATSNLKEEIAQIRKSLQSVTLGDQVSVSLYNHITSHLFSYDLPESVFMKFNSDNLVSFGTNSMANSLEEMLAQIKKKKISGKNIIILLSNSGENSSILTDLSSPIKIANEQNIPIYTIGIGSDIRSFQLEPVSNATGGRFYWVNSPDKDELSNVINEIYFGNKVNYKYKIRPQQTINSIDDIKVKVSVYNGSEFLDDSLTCFLKVPEIFTTNKILSVYNLNETVADQSFDVNLNKLAEFMKQNPAKRIEITGYSGNERNEKEADVQLSLERANQIKEKIVSLGVNPHRIRTKGAGSGFPLYFAPKNEGQSALNRRTELRWLDEELMPYEIIGDRAPSEYEADNLIKKWEEMGYKAYYKRSIEFDEIFYRVILWGYKTENHAKQESDKLKSTFENIEFKVE
jgi:outer membrane protein OmpA-like peptidoglycan-associated protein